MKKKGKTIIALCAVALVGIAAFALFNRSRGTGDQPLAASLAVAVRGPLEERVSASGSFLADRYTVVASKTVGIVSRVYVKPGDRVKRGDIIAVVDERDSREALNAAEIALEETRRNLSVELFSLRAAVRDRTLALDQAERAAKNAESLKAVDGLSEEDYRKTVESFEQAKATLADAMAKLALAQGLPAGGEPSLDPSSDGRVISRSPSYRRAELSVEGARRALEGCVIKADGPGTVTEITVATGSRLLNETVVARVEDGESVMAEVNVDEVDIGKISEGLPVEVTADSMLGTKIPGTVSRIWPIVKNDGNGRVCKVRVSLDLDGARYLSGASCMARITSVLAPDAITVPASALIPGANPPAVWVAVADGAATPEGAANPDGAADASNADDASTPDGADASDGAAAPEDRAKQPQETIYRAARREITIGASTVSTVEVLSGVAEGERVVIDQLNRVTEGAGITDAARAAQAPKK